MAALALFLGSVVTSLRVGMADPVWPTYPWHLFLLSWEMPSPGLIIEHAHRFIGYALGCCAIVLAIGHWFGYAGSPLRWLGPLALAGIIIQGLLGGLRVKLNELAGTPFALVHGCFGELVFALLGCLIVMSARRNGLSAPAGAATISSKLVAWSWLTAGLIYAQLAFGAILRHTEHPLGARGHLVGAFVTVVMVGWLARTIHEEDKLNRGVIWSVRALLAAVGLQILLGIESWLGKFGLGHPPSPSPTALGQSLIRSAHFVVGAMVFALAISIALQLYIQRRAALMSKDHGEPAWEGAA
jgi:cytochrome c oxidase assembly protein subunit 15